MAVGTGVIVLTAGSRPVTNPFVYSSVKFMQGGLVSFGKFSITVTVKS
jgi:hypothetical protein